MERPMSTKHIDESDLEDIAAGASLLGSGGGGDPVYDLFMAKEQFKRTGAITLVSLDEIADDSLVAPVGFMGAPLVTIERLPSGLEFPAILRSIATRCGREVDYLLATEIGGANALPPLMVASEMGLPVIDGDTIGRAFPELQISTCNLFDISASPAFLADPFGNVKVVEASSAIEMEELCRKITTEMGSCAALSLYLMSGKEAKRAVIPGSVSLASSIGRTLREANEKGVDAVEALALAHQGKIIAVGTIVDIHQSIQEGFLMGSVTIATDGGCLTVSFQNEYLLVSNKERCIAATPDIIALVLQETGYSILSESLQYGLRVALLIFPPPPIWKSEKGLALTAPQCFGYVEKQ